MNVQCNSCGAFAYDKPSAACSTCGTVICSSCKGNHEYGCSEAQKRKRRGEGPTVLGPRETAAAHSVGLAAGLDFNLAPKSTLALSPVAETPLQITEIAGVPVAPEMVATIQAAIENGTLEGLDDGPVNSTDAPPMTAGDPNVSDPASTEEIVAAPETPAIVLDEPAAN